MAFPENRLPILETLIEALWEATNDLSLTGDGLTNAKIAALANPGTVTGLRAALVALPWKERHKAKRDFIISAFDDASSPIFKLGAPTVTSATGSTSGGSLATGNYQVRVTAFDRLGNESAAGTAFTSNVASGSSGSIPVVIPANRGAVKYRVYYSAVAGAAGSEDEYLESTATAGITSGNVTVTITTRTVGGAVVSGTPPTYTAPNTRAGYGAIADIDVELGRAAGLFATMADAIGAQHPLGATLVRNFQGNRGGASFTTSTTVAP